MNLYQEYRLNPDDDCPALGINLAAQEVRLQQVGVPETDPRIYRLRTAYGVLAHEVTRARYDDALRTGAHVQFSELEHLANFGNWPLNTQPAGDPQPAGESQPNPFLNSKPYTPPTPPRPQFAQQQPGFPPVNPFFQTSASAAVPVPRPDAQPVMNRPRGASSDTRIAMSLLDGLISLCLLGFLMGLPGANDGIDALFNALVIIGYFLVPEVLWGGSPAKLMMGYQVQDASTGARLSWEQSMKRNWWRLVAAVPGLGTVISMIAAVIYTGSLGNDGSGQAIHDRIAHARVVKRD